MITNDIEDSASVKKMETQKMETQKKVKGKRTPNTIFLIDGQRIKHETYRKAVNYKSKNDALWWRIDHDFSRNVY